MKISSFEKTLYVFALLLIILMVGAGWYLYSYVGGIDPLMFSTHGDSRLIYTVPTSDRSFTFQLENDVYTSLTITKRDGKSLKLNLDTLPNGFITLALNGWTMSDGTDERSAIPPAGCELLNIYINGGSKYTPATINDSWSTEDTYFNSFAGFYCSPAINDKLDLEHI